MTPPLDIRYTANFVSSPAELLEQLIAQIEWDTRMYSRKTASFGAPYNYSGMDYPPIPMHPLLVPICERLNQTLGYDSNNCLINYYPNGESTMGFHSDATENLLPSTGIAIVSLGERRTLRFRAKRDRTVMVDRELESGSLIWMSQAVQREWQHAIPKTASDCPRLSLTFRSLIGESA